jgi:hypothetical protein
MQSPGDFNRRKELELAVGAQSADAKYEALGFDFIRRRDWKLRPE